ncbi:MAG: hypothetical protein ABSA45_08835 [Verrucomicrobiota bacterium]
MKGVGKIWLCLAGGLVWNAGLRAADLALANNPYAPIATRNVFDINPPAPVDPSKANAEPPVKITLNGITAHFGQLHALFKVAVPPKPGQPGKDQFYMLSEGQAQDDIEVTKIDEQAGLVTFNNHGTVQELPLANAAASGPSGPTQGAPGPGSKLGFSMPGNAPGGGNANNPAEIPTGNRFGQSRNFGGQNPNTAGGATPASRLGVVLGGAGGGAASPQPQIPLSADDQQALLAAQHAMAISGQVPIPPQIFPPTKYDDEAGVPSNLGPPPVPGAPATH